MQTNNFDKRISDCLDDFTCMDINTVQVNVGLKCNQRCVHCHVQASPDRTEMMDWPTMEAVISATSAVGAERVDITGGAPELNRHLRQFIDALVDDGRMVQVRTNMTALLLDQSEGLAEFFRDRRVQLVGSMPCYMEENVDSQRGKHVYEQSIEAIRKLNGLGYGIDEALELSLVYNPAGAFLPPDQMELEQDYRRELADRFGLHFSHLWTITNMPIGRFGERLRGENRHAEYLAVLAGAFNPDTLAGLMCRHQISVSWDGTLYDCDFNLALGLPVDHGAPSHMRRFNTSALLGRRIVTGEHCFGCTAGAGSSCGGALS